MATLVLLNNFMHDFSAAGWIFCSILLLTIIRSLPDSFEERGGDELYEVIEKMLKSVRLFMLFSLAGIVIFGIVRAFAYKQYEWSAASGDVQIILLIIKHILLTIVFAGGIYYYVKAGKLIKNNK
ncbi:MAG: hypothetical protein ABFR36_06895 [Acidobacteriota bacterium]